MTWARIALFALLVGTQPLFDADASSPDCSRAPGTLPDPTHPAGTRRADIPIEHIIVVMQENRSFDNYFGALSQAGYEGEVDGLSPELGNFDKNGKWISVFHNTVACSKEGENDWNTAHQMIGDGTNSAFVTTNDARVMGYYDQRDIPFWYAMANRFAIADRYFSSALAPTYPNRMFLMAGTSFGHVHNDIPNVFSHDKQPTIFDLLDQYGITWKYYFSDLPASLLFPRAFLRNLNHLAPAAEFAADAREGNLPEVTFLESSQAVGTEYSSFDYQVGEYALSKKIRAVMHGDSWATTAMFYTYDEAGGLYDHVPPPEACIPDGNAPRIKKGDVEANFDRYGFRVPFMLISPYAKRHHVSHVTYDHTSILRFIETKFNLPALSRRDANADPMMDLFDFSAPDLSVPMLPKVKIDAKTLWYCVRHVHPAP